MQWRQILGANCWHQTIPAYHKWVSDPWSGSIPNAVLLVSNLQDSNLLQVCVIAFWLHGPHYKLMSDPQSSHLVQTDVRSTEQSLTSNKSRMLRSQIIRAVTQYKLESDH